jgi:hypothetical protein
MARHGDWRWLSVRIGSSIGKVRCVIRCSLRRSRHPSNLCARAASSERLLRRSELGLADVASGSRVPTARIDCPPNSSHRDRYARQPSHSPNVPINSCPSIPPADVARPSVRERWWAYCAGHDHELPGERRRTGLRHTAALARRQAPRSKGRPDTSDDSIALPGAIPTDFCQYVALTVTAGTVNSRPTTARA